ncbi:MAG: zinc-ribbon domain-containing protein, partial [Collinsella sp.]
MPRFCTRCGKLLKDDERFCTSCGAPVTDEGQVSQAQEDAPFAENAPVPDAVSGADTTAAQPQP